MRPTHSPSVPEIPSETFPLQIVTGHHTGQTDKCLNDPWFYITTKPIFGTGKKIYKLGGKCKSRENKYTTSLPYDSNVHYVVTNYMEQRPFWKADSHSATLKICLLWNTEVHKSPPLDPILSQLNELCKNADRNTTKTFSPYRKTIYINTFSPHRKTRYIF
jgi:hypothetical protein